MAKGIKTGGRTKGTSNKKTLRFRDLLEKHSVNFEEELAKAILDGNVDMIRALKDLLPYLQPRIPESKAEDQQLPQQEANLQAVPTDNLLAFTTKKDE
jgi:hypothetical protein